MIFREFNIFKDADSGRSIFPEFDFSFPAPPLDSDKIAVPHLANLEIHVRPVVLVPLPPTAPQAPESSSVSEGGANRSFVADRIDSFVADAMHQDARFEDRRSLIIRDFISPSSRLRIDDSLFESLGDDDPAPDYYPYMSPPLEKQFSPGWSGDSGQDAYEVHPLTDLLSNIDFSSGMAVIVGG